MERRCEDCEHYLKCGRTRCGTMGVCTLNGNTVYGYFQCSNNKYSHRH